MREAQEYFKMFLDAPIGIATLEGPEHTFTHANNYYVNMLFGGGREFLGKTVRDAVPEVSGQGFFERLDEVYRTGKSFVGKEIPVRLRQNDGRMKEFLLDFIYQALRDATERISGIMVIATDVTEHVQARRQVEASAKLLRMITDRLPAFVSYMDADGRYRFVNRKYTDWFEKPASEIEGRSRAELLAKENTYDYIAPFEAQALAGKPVSFELTLSRRGETMYLDTEFLPDIDPATQKVRGFIGVGQDVTERKRAAEDLKAAKDAAEQANATKSAFLANMSHEIRTPLGAILGFSGLLKDAALSPQERRQYIETINRNGQSLTRIIDDILDLAKVEAGLLDVEEIGFSLFGLLSEVMDLFTEKAKQKGISLAIKIDERMPSHILSDPTRLRQILINLVGNAVKFTETGGVTLRVRGEKSLKEGYDVEIEIQDTGRGLTADQNTRLFKPFTQADNTTTRRFGGTGLGLALSKRLSQALGGDIRVGESKPGQGTTFVITFHAREVRNPDQPLRHPAILANQLPLQHVKVLLVDDSPDNQFLVKRILVKNGAEVEVAANGLEAVEKARGGAYDVVLMDIQMPEMDGYQATRSLLASGYKKPIIALTAHAMVEERAKTREAGFAGHLTKPLNNEELIETVAAHAKRGLEK